MDTIEPIRFILSFILVLGLVGIMYIALKYFAASGKLTGLNAKTPNARLEVIETRYLDARRRLVLIRRDQQQHLLLLADGRETLLESFTAEAPHA